MLYLLPKQFSIHFVGGATASVFWQPLKQNSYLLAVRTVFLLKCMFLWWIPFGIFVVSNGTTPLRQKEKENHSLAIRTCRCRASLHKSQVSHLTTGVKKKKNRLHSKNERQNPVRNCSAALWSLFVNYNHPNSNSPRALTTHLVVNAPAVSNRRA